MMSDNIYTFEDESPFVEREEGHEIYREIYGDPIYDTYEDDVDVIDFVFKEDLFEDLMRAKSGRSQIRLDFGFVQNPVCAKIVQIQIRASFGSNPVCVKVGQVKGR
ncbi:unnamed protein product [Microthlaspi erraticum]|uniref:Uncharacterized protein n=1 Tax=Microthlaspi erraticum TaxID=1685480 RepID=A0A6D2ISY8_9BRAS|nr:unnamed protein product [Microthlaspi erraticum]